MWVSLFSFDDDFCEQGQSEGLKRDHKKSRTLYHKKFSKVRRPLIVKKYPSFYAL